VLPVIALVLFLLAAFPFFRPISIFLSGSKSKTAMAEGKKKDAAKPAPAEDHGYEFGGP
jgi:hypothetical protein